jgi:lipopolysaccharide transport protein LptA
VNGRASCLVLGLLCPLAALAEPAANELERLAPTESTLERALPDSLHGEARAANRQVHGALDSGDGPFSLGDFDRSAPVVIRADELEATEQDGRREIVFRRHVQVRQGTLEVNSDELSALYPAGAKQPSRLEAKGAVTVREGTRSARCERVVYDRLARTLACLGQGSLRDGDDRMAGQSIRFDLARRTVSVGGGTEVWFEPRSLARQAQGEEKGASGLPVLRETIPARVRASKLEASDDESGRHIAFEGDVELSQQGTTLRAQRLEALYPPGVDQPDRLVAVGGVSLSEGMREAQCERAEYLRLENRVLCQQGVAHNGDDRLEGDVIDFALGEEKLAVRGHTRLVLAPREPGSATP